MDSQWRKSTRSGGNGACLEARYADHTAQVRDTKDRQGPMLSFTAGQWTHFVQGIKAGTLDA
ncbi:DUF397 domain-containing protein [Micromonospora sp. WMMD1082]|uniref:DUF397 domain-containing protein n=1 Tax=Micromonospora sp. WMMD1082 TaxID=3016104 RepID=UPI00241619A6|nr:DUF397 domain-containing protein [Micromonospora sp. WMMD1082]MDG4798252.1 DUF397 domain-containing protein [Micromonospora sp. WMMD1082]